jgi:hypothetical protein
MMMLHLLITCKNQSNCEHWPQIDQTVNIELEEKLMASFIGHMKNLLPRFLVHLYVKAMSLQSLHFGHIISGKPVTSSTTGGGTACSGVDAPSHCSNEPRQTLVVAEPQ